MCLTPSPRQTGRVGVRGKYLKIKRLLTLPHSSPSAMAARKKNQTIPLPLLLVAFPVIFQFFQFFVRAPARACVYLRRAFFMATLKPFAALRPQPGLAAQICELPYDVMSSDEAREIARGNPLSFLHVSKPEIDLPPGTDLYSPEVYAQGRENFQKLIAQGALKVDS